MKKLIILASARKDGDTQNMAAKMQLRLNCDLIDLNDYNISYFDYEHKNRDDDFIELMRKIIDNYELLIFATPVYWYSMSGRLKVFFDRITDLLIIEKDLGRKLRGKHMAVFTSSTGNNLGENFWLPFKEMSIYLGINYVSGLHTQPNKIDEKKEKEFVNSIEKAS